MNLTMALIKADIIAAKQAIAYYKNHKLKDIKNIAAYHLQQATEKLIKIQIYSKSTNYNNASLYTHNIEKLIAYGKSLNIDLFVPDYIDTNSLVITNWEAGSRYDIGFQVKIASLDKTIDVIEQWYDLLYQAGIRNG